jgi:hypothetical protein
MCVQRTHRPPNIASKPAEMLASTPERRGSNFACGQLAHARALGPNVSFGSRPAARLFRSALDALKVVEDLKKRGVALHLRDLGGDISGNGLSKLFLTIAAAFAEAERDRIRERIGQVKADQKARGRYLGGKVPFGFRLGDSGELVRHEGEQEAIREIVSLRTQGKALRAIAQAVGGKAISSAMRAWQAC